MPMRRFQQEFLIFPACRDEMILGSLWRSNWFGVGLKMMLVRQKVTKSRRISFTESGLSDIFFSNLPTREGFRTYSYLHRIAGISCVINSSEQTKCWKDGISGLVGGSLSIVTVAPVTDLTPVTRSKTIPVEFELTEYDVAIEFRFPNLFQ